MALLRRGWGKVVLGLSILLAFYAFTRFFGLMKLPIFTDEAIYIRWSQIGAQDANWRFISLTDGKQPMFTWVVMALFRMVPGDPLFVGRLASVLTGAVSLVGMWFLSWEIFRNKRVAWIGAILYLLSPFSLWYDRMALYDSMVATFFIWNLYIAIRLVREVRLDLALLLGMSLGAGMLNKTSGFLSLYLLPSTILLFDFTKGKAVERLGRWLQFIITATILSQVFYSILRLSPFFHMIAQKDTVFVYPMSEWIKHPFEFLRGNLSGQSDWLRHYMTLPIFLASIAPVVIFWRHLKEKLVLYIHFLGPFIALALFGKVLYPRFILFMAMPLLPIAAVSIDWILTRIKSRLWLISALTILAFPSLWMDYYIVTNPLNAPIPYSDKGQYVDSWPAGWGVREVNNFLRIQATKGKVAVFTEGTFGLMPASIEMYLVDKPNVEIHGFWPMHTDMPADMVASAKVKPTYFVMNQTQEVPAGWPLELIAEYQKGNRKNQKLRLYKVLVEKPAL